MDDKFVVYGRVADSIFNGLEATGGFYECLHHLGFLIVFFIQERMFKSQFIRELYQVPSNIRPEHKNIQAREMLR